MTQNSAFHWTPSNWWGGAVLGCSAWLIPVAGFLIAFNEIRVASVPLVALAINLIAATWLWTQRERISAFRGLMIFGGMMAVELPAVWYAVHFLASPMALNAMNWPRGGWQLLLVLGVVPAILVKFYLMERSARNVFQGQGFSRPS